MKTDKISIGRYVISLLSVVNLEDAINVYEINQSKYVIVNNDDA